MTRSGFAALATISGAAAFVVAGCNGSGSAGPPSTAPRLVDDREVESVLVANQRRASPDLNVGAASCPQRATVSEGATLECTVEVDGVPAPYLVTLRDVDARTGGRYDVRPAKAILLVPRLVQAMKTWSGDAASTVECGPARVRVLDVGGSFDCRLTTPQGARTVRVLVEDVEGRVSFQDTP